MTIDHAYVHDVHVMNMQLYNCSNTMYINVVS